MHIGLMTDFGRVVRAPVDDSSCSASWNAVGDWATSRPFLVLLLLHLRLSRRRGDALGLVGVGQIAGIPCVSLPYLAAHALPYG